MSVRTASQVPSSFIKAPGALFIKRNDPFDPITSQGSSTKLLFKQFKSHLDTFDLLPIPSKPKQDKVTVLEEFLVLHSSEDEASPGKKMNCSENIYTALKKAREILSL